MGYRQQLQDFIGDRYPDEKKLQAFVSDTFGKRAHKAIGWGSGLANACNDLITWIESKGAVAKLWPALRSDNPAFATDINKHEAAWPVDPTRDPGQPAVPFFQRKAVRIAMRAVLASGVIASAIGIYIKTRPDPTSLIVVPDADAQNIMGGVNPFTIVLSNGEPLALPREGFSIGKGDLVPDDVAEEYRRHRRTGMPIEVDIKLTSKLVSELKVFYESTPCPKPEIDIEKDSVWLVQLGHCR